MADSGRALGQNDGRPERELGAHGPSG